MDTPALPARFRPIELGGGYFAGFGPLYACLDNGVPVLAFRAGAQHMNPMGTCHGGALAGFADMQALGAQQIADVTDRFTATVNLSIDYIRPVKLGEWVEMRIELLRATQSLLFSQGLIMVAGTLVARSSGIYFIRESPRNKREPLEPFFK